MQLECVFRAAYWGEDGEELAGCRYGWTRWCAKFDNHAENKGLIKTTTQCEKSNVLEYCWTIVDEVYKIVSIASDADEKIRIQDTNELRRFRLITFSVHEERSSNNNEQDNGVILPSVSTTSDYQRQ